jgi:hypothetical protein
VKRGSSKISAPRPPRAKPSTRSGTLAATSTSRSLTRSTTSAAARSTPIATPKLWRACASRSAASVGAGWSTPAYSTPCRSMNSRRTAQNSGEFMACGVPWLLLSYLP